MSTLCEEALRKMLKWAVDTEQNGLVLAQCINWLATIDDWQFEEDLIGAQNYYEKPYP